MSLPLTKTLDPADFALLPKELARVDVFFHAEAEQHEMRRWEYALALDAALRWQTQAVSRGGPWAAAHVAYDVGGAGSPFHTILGDAIWRHVEIIDPASPAGRSLETTVRRNPALGDIVTCLSVIEHVEDLDRFLYHLSCLTAPGGLLFLTMDCRESPAPGQEVVDDRHFHWMRKRIFSPGTLYDLVYAALHFLGFQLFGGVDLAYHGHYVFDYSFASLALIKRA